MAEDRHELHELAGAESMQFVANGLEELRLVHVGASPHLVSLLPVDP